MLELEWHKETEHTNLTQQKSNNVEGVQESFSCPFCSIQSDNSTTLGVHIKNVHFSNAKKQDMDEIIIQGDP